MSEQTKHDESGGHFAALRAEAKAAEDRAATLRGHVVSMTARLRGVDPTTTFGRMVLESFERTNADVDPTELEAAFNAFADSIQLEDHTPKTSTEDED